MQNWKGIREKRRRLIVGKDTNDKCPVEMSTGVTLVTLLTIFINSPVTF
jgi:hypothetical protein